MSLYHLHDPEGRANPYPLYHRLQSLDPVHWDPFLHAWVLTHYEDVAMVLSDRQRFSARVRPSPEDLAQLEDLAPFAGIHATLAKQQLFLDPPEHERWQKSITNYFARPKVQRFRAMIEHIVKTLLDKIVQDQGPMGEVDLISALAVPLPLLVMIHLLELPVEDAPQLKSWSDLYALLLSSFHHLPADAWKAVQQVQHMNEYFLSHLRKRRASAGQGLLDELMRSNQYQDDELAANLIMLVGAGHETTTNLIGNGLAALLTHSEQYGRLRTDLSLLPEAIEEMLRYDSPTQYTARYARERVEISGSQIMPGQSLILVLGAANRDPALFADPDQFNLSRENKKHLAFGHGVHFCAGAWLARLEATIAFQCLLEQFSPLQLTCSPHKLAWRDHANLRGLQGLPVRYRKEEPV